VLGPAFRKAIARFDVDVILDGEVSAWDDVRKEYVPFGNNRTVAANQKQHMKQQGLLDERDFNLHEQDEEGVHRSVNLNVGVKPKDDDDSDTLGCWLKYEAFDVLYVGGKDASALLSAAVSEHRKPQVVPGSIMHLDAFERKKVLYRLLDPQPNQIEIVPTLVVRSNGHTAKGSDYFASNNPTEECGFPAYTLDSIDCTFNGVVPDLASIDRQRRGGFTDAQINEARVEAVEHFYDDIVETRMLEGLIFKDLSAPYVLGETSRRLKYWHKIKPDYAMKSWAADIDVVILGAFYGTGLKNSGVLSHFLLGCVDSANEGTFLTFCKINGRSLSNDKLKAIENWTGFKKPEEPGGEVHFGKWYHEDDHGKSLPDFISRRSYQKGRDKSGWAFNRSDQYPDLWIHPEDSVVLTVYGAEITPSDDFSVGLTLRFPRIDRVRLDDVNGNEKSPFEVASDLELWRRLQDADQKRSEAEHAREFHAGSPSNAPPKASTSHGFLTPELFVQSTKTKRKKAALAGFWSMPTVEVESCVLRGVTCTVLQGRYLFDKTSLDAEEAREQGWFDLASQVRHQEDVMKFILQHGGLVKLGSSSDTTFVLGGQDDDAKVVGYHKAKKNAWAQKIPKNAKSKAAQAIESVRHASDVLKWTFVYSLVQRWFTERRVELSSSVDDEGDEILCIKKNKPEMLIPKPSDYLLSSEVLDSDNLFGLSEASEITMISLKRSLDAIRQQVIRLDGQSNKRGKPARLVPIPWQYEAMRSLPTNARWVMRGTVHSLWSFTGDFEDTAEEVRPVVLYPDVFEGCFGLSFGAEATDRVLCGEKSAQWNEQDMHVLDAAMDSAISLARTMGALVTPHLHNGVTHILCSMLPGVEQRVWNRYYNDLECNLEAVFSYPTRGERLVERLQSLSVREVTLVSPSWVRSQWIA
jgi:DNA ligase-4